MAPPWGPSYRMAAASTSGLSGSAAPGTFQLGEDRLRDDRGEDLVGFLSFFGARGRRVAAVGLVEPRIEERAVAALDRVDEARLEGREVGAHVLLHEVGAHREDERGLVAARVAGSAPELLREPSRERAARDVGEERVAARALGGGVDGGAERGDVGRLEVRVDERDRAEALLEQRDEQVGQHGRGVLGGGADGARETRAERDRGIADRGQNERAAVRLLEPQGRPAGGLLGDQDVGRQGQVRPVGLDGSDRQEDDRSLVAGACGLLGGEVFEAHDRRRYRPRSRLRWTFPRSLRGRTSRNSTQRGYLYGESFPFTKALSSSARAGPAAAASRGTTNAFGFVRPPSSSAPTTQTSFTAPCFSRQSSISRGETKIPLTLSMSSARPSYQ